ncbi:hypothetical protein Tco_0267306 [Tanacetum coccineum]
MGCLPRSACLRVKEEDSITDVENAAFDLGVMDSLCFLFIDQRVLIGMITKFIKFIELNFSVITRGGQRRGILVDRGPIENPESEDLFQRLSGGSSHEDLPFQVNRESLSITNFEGHGLVIVLSGSFVHSEHRSKPCRLKKVFLKLGEPRNCHRNQDTNSAEEERSNFTEKLPRRCGRWSRNSFGRQGHLYHSVLVQSWGELSSFQIGERAIRLMLHRDSAKAKNSIIFGNHHGRVSTGVSKFLGNFLRINAEFSRFPVVFVNSNHLILGIEELSKIWCQIWACVGEPSHDKARILVKIVPPILVEIDPPILVVLMVLHRRKTGRSNLVCEHLRSVTGIPLVVVNCGGFVEHVFLDIVTINVALVAGPILVRMTNPEVTQLGSYAFTGRDAGVGFSLSRRINAA